MHTKGDTEEGMTVSSGACRKHSEMRHLGWVLTDEEKWWRSRDRCFTQREKHIQDPSRMMCMLRHGRCLVGQEDSKECLE